MTELEQDIQRVLELVVIDKKPSSSVKQKVLEQPKPRKLWRNFGLPMVAVLSLILVVSTGIILYSKNGGALPRILLSESKSPIPTPFTHLIDIVAESYPVHPDQTFTIQPKDKSWNGKEVKIYYLEETESTDLAVLHQKVLPSNAQYIGSAVIDQGKWSFQWKAPSKVQPQGYNNFLVVAQSDEGTLSAVRLGTLLYDKLEVTPSTVKVGQKVELRGAGFPVGDIRVDVLQRNTAFQTTKGSSQDYYGDFNFQTTIGSVHSYDGSFNYSIEVTPKNHITPGNYQVIIYFAMPGTVGEAVRVNLKVE